MFKHSVSLASVLILAAACTPGKSIKDEVGGQFWQRISVSEAVYQQGPKAQQMLNRDISRCVTELRELERLGTLKGAIPTDIRGRTLDPDERQLADWDSPERNKHLYSEHTDYTDFEGCMGEKGWERVEHTPFDVARKGRINYLRAHVDKEYVPEVEREEHSSQPTSNEVGDFGNLNE